MELCLCYFYLGKKKPAIVWFCLWKEIKRSDWKNSHALLVSRLVLYLLPSPTSVSCEAARARPSTWNKKKKKKKKKNKKNNNKKEKKTKRARKKERKKRTSLYSVNETKTESWHLFHLFRCLRYEWCTWHGWVSLVYAKLLFHENRPFSVSSRRWKESY